MNVRRPSRHELLNNGNIDVTSLGCIVRRERTQITTLRTTVYGRRTVVKVYNERRNCQSDDGGSSSVAESLRICYNALVESTQVKVCKKTGCAFKRFW